MDVQALKAHEVIPPGDLAAALDAAVGAADNWGRLPVSHRRELTRFLEDARTPSTRARRVESPRFRRIETLSPYTHLYTVRATEPSDVDGELAAWLREAYAVGCQEHLRSPTA